MRRLVRCHSLVLCLAVCGPAITAMTPAPQPVIPPGNSSVTGRVTERESGRALEAVSVTLILVNTWTTPQTTVTDAEGRYEFRGVAGGAYRVEPQLKGYAVQDRPGAVNPSDGLLTLRSGQQLKDIDFKLTRGGSIHGQITDQQGLPIAGVMVAAANPGHAGAPPMNRGSSAKSDDRGNYVVTDLAEGNYLLVATVNPLTWSNPIRVPSRQTYYPGTTSRDDATLVKLGPAEILRDVNIMVAPSEFVRLTGQVLRGSHTGAVEGILLATGASVRTLEISEDGAFEATDIAPGRYTISVRARDRSEAGVATLDVETDMSGISLPLTPTSTIAGRLVTDDGGPLPPEYLQVAAVLAVDGKPIDPLSRDRSEVTLEGAFELSGLFGERTMNVIGLGNGWTIHRMLHGKRAVKSLSLIPGADVRDLTIVLRRP